MKITVEPTKGFNPPLKGREYQATYRADTNSGYSMYGSTPEEARTRLEAWLIKTRRVTNRRKLTASVLANHIATCALFAAFGAIWALCFIFTGDEMAANVTAFWTGF